MIDKQMLQHFDAVFGTNTLKNIDFKNMKLLEALIEYFGSDLYEPSPEYKKLMRKSIEITDKLQATFSAEQEKLFYKYEELNNAKSKELEDQLFMFGYIVCSELQSEAKNGLKKAIENN